MEAGGLCGSLVRPACDTTSGGGRGGSRAMPRALRADRHSGQQCRRQRARRPGHMSEEVWQQQLDLNLDTAFLGCKHVLPVMERQFEEGGRGGAIVNIGSIGSMTFQVGGRVSAAYAASKAGGRPFQPLDGDRLSRKGIRVNTVVPGAMHTPLVEHRLARQLGTDDAAKLIAEPPRERADGAHGRRLGRGARRAVPGERRGPLHHRHPARRRWRHDRRAPGMSSGQSMFRVGGKPLSRPVIITCAVTGSGDTTAASPYVPVTPNRSPTTRSPRTRPARPSFIFMCAIPRPASPAATSASIARSSAASGVRRGCRHQPDDGLGARFSPGEDDPNRNASPGMASPRTGWSMCSSCGRTSAVSTSRR